jgi:hypothetical protein
MFLKKETSGETYRALRDAPDMSVIVDAAREAFTTCYPSPRLQPLVVVGAASDEAGNTCPVLDEVCSQTAGLPEMAGIGEENAGRLHVRQACAACATGDDPDHMARWHFETAFQAPQEGWERVLLAALCTREALVA